MKRKNKNEKKSFGNTAHSQPTVFEVMMNVKCDLHAELGLEPLPHWKQTRQAPEWVKNIYGKLRGTIFRSLLKLKPKRKFNWRNYGRCIGILERHKTFLAKDVPRIFKKDGFDKISNKKLAKLQPLLGEEEARQYCLKMLKLPANDKTPFSELIVMAFSGQMANFEKDRQTAFIHLANQPAKTVKIFLKGMSEGYTTFMNEYAEFSGDDRRADIHLELIAWQHDIEKMRKSVLPKTSNHLIGELKKLPEFKNKTQDWFKDVFKDIHLSIGRRGRPPQYSQT